MRTAKIFQNGQSQAIRLPKEFRFKDDQVYIKKSGNIVILIPKSNSWDSLNMRTPALCAFRGSMVDFSQTSYLNWFKQIV